MTDLPTRSSQPETPGTLAVTPYPPFPPYYPAPEDAFGFLDLLRVIRHRWWLVALVTVLGASAALYYALTATPIFRAQAVIAPPAQKQQGGASAALAALGGVGAELAGSMGLSIGSADANRLAALLQSHRLTNRVITKHDLLPTLFSEKWDKENKKWRTGSKEDDPTVWDAARFLAEEFRVKHDVKTGMLTLTLDLADPQAAQQILQHFLNELALAIQQDELRKIKINEEFAKQQLRQAVDPLLLGKLQAILADQMEKAMMARNMDSFAFEIIDPPVTSDQKVRPRRALISVLGLGGSFFAGVLLALLGELGRKTAKSVPQPHETA